LDRYRAIIYPLKGTYSKLRAKVNLIIVWMLGIVLALPNLLLFEVSHQEISKKFPLINYIVLNKASRSPTN